MIITKQQFGDIVSKAPKGTDSKEIMNGLIQKGHTLEGYTPPVPEIKKPSLYDKATSNITENSTGLEKAGSLLNPMNQARQFVKGAASFTGLTELAGKGLNKLTGTQNFSTPEDSPINTVKEWAEPKSMVDLANPGRVAEMVGEFAMPEAGAAKVSKIVGGVVDTATKVPNFLKAGTKLVTRMGASGVATGGVMAAETGDPSQMDFTKLGSGAQWGAAIPGAGAIIGSAKRAMTGTLAENIGKAVGMTGKMNTTTALEAIPKAKKAFQTLYNEAKGTVVKDLDGIEKAFEPSKATFGETLQALKTSKDNIYNKYSELANKAGEAGATFVKNDFMEVIDGLKSISKNSTKATKDKVNGLIQDMIDNYGTVKNGKVSFGNTKLSDIQGFIEDINADVNPLSNKAGAVVSDKASKFFREIMDKKIFNAKGDGYQALRSSYSDLKSIETALINQFKKQSRGLGSGVSDWVGGFGNLDTVVGMITGNPSQAIKGVGMNWMSKIIKNLRSPEAKLQKVFQELEKGVKEGSDVKNFLFGSQGKELTEAEQKIVAKVKEMRPGLSLEDVSKKSPLIQEARKYKSADDFVKAQGEPLYHGTNADFKVFDEKRIGSATDEGMFGSGFYFGNTESFARIAPKGMSAKNVMEVYPSSSNFFDVAKIKSKKEMAELLNMSEAALVKDSNGIIRPVRGQSAQFTSHLKDIGYDGVIVKRGGDAIETVIFDAKNLQTKSQLTDIWNKSQPLQEGAKITKKEITENMKDSVHKGLKDSIKSLESKLKNASIDKFDLFTKRLNTAKEALKRVEKKNFTIEQYNRLMEFIKINK